MTHGLLIHAEDVPRPRMWLILGQPVGSDKRPLRVLTGCRVCSCFCKYNVLYIFMVNEKSLGKKRCVPKYGSSRWYTFGACIGFDFKLEMLCSFNWIYLCFNPFACYRCKAMILKQIHSKSCSKDSTVSVETSCSVARLATWSVSMKEYSVHDTREQVNK